MSTSPLYAVADPLPTDYWTVAVASARRFLIGLTYYDAAGAEVAGGDATVEGSWREQDIVDGAVLYTRFLDDPATVTIPGGGSKRYDSNNNAAIDFRVTAITPPGGATHYRLTVNTG